MRVVGVRCGRHHQIHIGRSALFGRHRAHQAFTSAFGEHVIAEEVEALQDALAVKGSRIPCHAGGESLGRPALPQWFVEFTEMPRTWRPSPQLHAGVVERIHKDLITVFAIGRADAVKRGTFNGNGLVG